MMDTITLYTPMVRSLAAGFAQTPESREDLAQEGFIKILKLQNLHPNQDFSSEDWRARFYVAIKNCMIDHVRKSLRRGRFHADVEEGGVPLDAKSSTPTAFEALATDLAVKELMYLLPDLEAAVLQELLQPSDDYRWFVRQKRAVRNIARKYMKFVCTADGVDSADATLAEYLEINPARFNEAITRIREVASENSLFYW